MLDMPLQTTLLPDAAWQDDVAGLRAFVRRHPRLFVLTGAGCSTDSGLPDYRDADGQWKRPQPVTYQAFVRDIPTRRRYWARALLGWPRFASVRPNQAHHALARLEQAGHCQLLLTQNVDRLHQAAGSRAVIDLHGRLDEVVCLVCAHRLPRDVVQDSLARLNPGWAGMQATIAPDGDADLEGADFMAFQEPPCPRCGGLLKPDVVFFGENVPKDRVEAAREGLVQSDAMLVAGSSLMVFSGYRFVQAAIAAGKPVAAINLGRTRADPLLALKLERPCGEMLAALA